MDTDSHRLSMGGPSNTWGAVSPQAAPALHACGIQGRATPGGLGSKRAWTRPTVLHTGRLLGFANNGPPLRRDATNASLWVLSQPRQAGRPWARRGLQSSWLEEQAPNDAHPGRQCLPGTRSVATTGGPRHGPRLPIRRQPSVCICGSQKTAQYLTPRPTQQKWSSTSGRPVISQENLQLGCILEQGSLHCRGLVQTVVIRRD